ncbi:MAG: hypothetical protein IKU60_04570 [Clostridia bacterium]|nr:hypothetical protein [Clostridia bacterium]
MNGRTSLTKYDYAQIDVNIAKTERDVCYEMNVQGDISGADLYVALYNTNGEMIAVRKNKQMDTFENSAKDAECLKVMLLDGKSLEPLKIAVAKKFL